MRTTPFAVALVLCAGLWGQTDQYQLPAEQRKGNIKMLYVVSLSHLDIGYTKPSDQVARDYKDDVDTAIRLARENPDYRWTFETAWQVEEWLRRNDDEKAVAELGALIRGGRLGLGVFFANMNSGLMGAEEMNRMVYAGERLRRRLGVAGLVAYHDDVPGSSWSYPRVLAGSGVKYLVTGLNVNLANPNRATLHPGNNLGQTNRPFYWTGPDGSRVLQWFTRDLMQYGEASEWRLGVGHFGVVHPIQESERMIPRRLAWLEQNGYPYDRYLLMGSPGDNSDPYKAYLILLQIREWNRKHPELVIRMATAEEFFHDLIEKYGNKFPAYPGDATGGWEEKKLGVPDSAAKMREASNILPAAETAATLATALYGAPYPRYDMDDAWRSLLTYHEHSQGEGDWGMERHTRRADLDWNIVDYYANAVRGYSNANQQFEKALRRLAGLRAHTHPLEPDAAREGVFKIMVYNGLSWKRSGPVMIESLPAGFEEGALSVTDLATGEKVACESEPGNPRRMLFFAKDIPSVGYRLFSIQKAASEAGAGKGALPIDVAWNGEGRITSIRDVKTGREMLDRESKQGFGEWFVAARGAEFQPGAKGAATVTVKDGAVARRIEFRREGSAVALTITLYRDAPWADLSFDADLSAPPRGTRRYAVALPLAHAGEVLFNGAGFVYRIPQDRLPGGGGPDRLAGLFTHFRQSASWGITLANQDGAFWGADPFFCLASFPGTVVSGARRNLARSEPVLSLTQAFRFRLAVEGSDAFEWEHLGAGLNLPLRAAPVGTGDMPGQKAFIEVSDPAAQLMAFKPAEAQPGWYMLRLQEIGGRGAHGVKVKLPFPAGDALLADTVERPTARRVNLEAITLEPWQTVTIVVKPR